jgi:hypothetical protein
MNKQVPEICGRWHHGREKTSEGHANSPERLMFEGCWMTDILFYDLKVAQLESMAVAADININLEKINELPE